MSRLSAKNFQSGKHINVLGRAERPCLPLRGRWLARKGETEEDRKVGISDVSVERFCHQTLDSRKPSALVALFRPRSSGTFPGGEGFFSHPAKFLFIPPLHDGKTDEKRPYAARFLCTAQGLTFFVFLGLSQAAGNYLRAYFTWLEERRVTSW